MKSRWMVQAALAAALAGAPALAQKSFVYPSKGQSPQQQQKDEYECHQWAVQQTGYDPSKPQRQVAAPPPSQSAGPEAGSGAKGAVKGAVVGGMAARSRSREQQQQQQAQQQQAAQQQAAAANAAGPDAYNRARSACLSGRGYTVN